MRHLFGWQSRPVLRRLAEERSLCAFDFDGTLAPIVERPDDAAMRPETRALLVRLAQLYPCVILSGRARSDLIPRLEGVAARRILGSHGAENEANSGVAQHRIEAFAAELAGRIGARPGIWIENKGCSLAVHYRQYPRKAEAREVIEAALAQLEGAQVVGGKQVYNVMEAGAPTKGVALLSERDRLQCDWALFVGDDDNDEDAFAVGGNTVGVRVGRKVHSEATYYLKSQGEIDELLSTLVQLRETDGRP